MLGKYPEHPLLAEIESDRRLVISTQKKKDIAINQSLLTHDILLKRRIMKRCIFGVDNQPSCGRACTGCHCGLTHLQ